MVRYTLITILAVLFVTGCGARQDNRRQATETQSPSSQDRDVATSTAAPVATDTLAPPPSITPSEEKPTATQVQLPTDTPEPATATAEPSPTASGQMALHDLSFSDDDILFYPVPDLVEGDLVSIEVVPSIPRGLAPNDVEVQILLDGHELVSGVINWRKLSGDMVGLYQWVWDTTDQAGIHKITAILDPQDQIKLGDEDPDNNQVSVDVQVLPQQTTEDTIQSNKWITATVPCCVVHAVSGTAADRDLEELLPVVDDAFNQASQKLGEPLSEKYHVYLIDRVIGQGGYTIDRMVISYLDRNYAGGGLQELLVHEATHLIDRQFAPNSITFLSEGVAVWTAGGHYQQQDLGQRMKALIELGQYVPIQEVIANFFSTQHEISYLEGASLIDYLVKAYGWPVVRKFYSEATVEDGPNLVEAVDFNMRFYFGRSLDQIEADWMAYLSRLPRDRTVKEGLTTTLRYYDIMREYQIAYDPTAYYLYAWLPAPEIAEQNGATAVFTRHPGSDINIATEAMLISANQALLEEDYVEANALLDSVSRVINNGGRFLDPLAKSYLNIISIATEEGFEVQQVNLSGNQASALASDPEKRSLITLEFVLNNDRTWSMAP